MTNEVHLNQLKPHPRNTEIYGEDQHIKDLAESIQKHGLQKALVITQNFVIVSGHSRYQALKMIGATKAKCEIVHFDDDTDILERLLIENEYRQKTNLQIIKEVELRLEIEQERAKQKQVEAGQNFGKGSKVKLQETFPEALQQPEKKQQPKKPAPQSRDKAAEKQGITGRTAGDGLKASAKIKELEEKGKSAHARLVSVALNNGFSSGKNMAEIIDQLSDEDCKKMTDAIVNEKMSVPAAIKNYNKKKEIDETKQAYTESTKTDAPPVITIVDCKEYLATFEDNSIDLLITDPPYMTDVDDIEAFAQSWLPLALQKVKPDGRAYICIGAYPKEVQAYFAILLNQDKFILDNPLIWTYRNTLGQTPKMKYNLNYQMVLHLYSKASAELDTTITKEMFSVQDINAPDGRQGNRLHTWQKPDELAKRLVRHSTKEDDIVVDCFACTGTFLLAAAAMGRKALGCELNAENAAIAKQRGCDVKG